jgi:hypothetical protein
VVLLKQQEPPPQDPPVYSTANRLVSDNVILGITLRIARDVEADGFEL